jgi:hypothetical protein
MDTYETLLAKARSHFGVQSASSVSDIAALLQSLGAERFEYEGHRDQLEDEFVDWNLVVGAYSLTEASMLRRLATDEEVENFTADPDEVFDPLEFGTDEAEWTLFAREVETLARLIVIVERNPQVETVAGNFRVFGAGQWLRETLWAATGVVPRDPGAPSIKSELFGHAFRHVGRKPFHAAPIL